MAVPKRRTSKMKKRQRRSHMAAKTPQYESCPQCKTAKPSHAICPGCGYYMGRTLVDMDN